MFHLLPKGITVFAFDFSGSGGRSCRDAPPRWRRALGPSRALARDSAPQHKCEPSSPPLILPCASARARVTAGLSEGQYVTLGALEVDDLAAVVDYLRREVSAAGGGGLSRGGA